MEEREIIAKARAGDESAFELVVKMYEKKVYSFCLRMSGNCEDALDLAQETFLKVYKSLKSFRGDSSFSSWLYRLMSNVCIDFLRKRKKEKTVSLYSRREDGEELRDRIPDSAPTPHEQAEKSELYRAMEKALEKLSPEHRQVIILREITGLSYSEISEATGIGEGTVKSRISRARAQLCAELEKSGNFFPEKPSKKREGGV